MWFSLSDSISPVPPFLFFLWLSLCVRRASYQSYLCCLLLLPVDQDGREALSSEFGSLKEGKRQVSFNISAVAVSEFDLLVDSKEKDWAFVHFAAC